MNEVQTITRSASPTARQDPEPPLMADASPASRVEGRDLSDHGNLTNHLMQGLRSIFGGFADRPDFSAFHEQDVNRRLYRPWARVGDSMRLALGKPITFIITHPDGTRASHVIARSTSNKKFLNALHQAKEAMQGSDEEFLADEVVITVTGKEAGRLVALSKKASRPMKWSSR